MYAILRSYCIEDAYAAPGQTIEQIATLVAEHDRLADALKGGALLDDLLKGGPDAGLISRVIGGMRSSPPLRITSYNVCYTKLLRR